MRIIEFTLISAFKIGHTIQIDISVIIKKKYNLLRVVKKRQIFGGTWKETGECFCLSVPNRKAKSLFPLIEDYVEPFRIIHSDCWKDYNKIDKLDGCYIHQTVNHNEYFVECLWREIKRQCRRCEGIVKEISLQSNHEKHLR